MDYIQWRGDLSILQDEFNEIDSLILSRFSYFPLDEIIEENEIVTIQELSKRFQEKDRSNLAILWEDDVDLFPLMGQSKRFGEMKVSRYVNKISEEEEKQFSAVTIQIPDDTIFISYRGTDNTIIGWKEDFNMSFQNHVASQLDAVKYLEEVAEQLKRKTKIRIGGHSKGGNLAVYAAIFASNKVKDRILKIYNNDGPGFGDEITKTKEYKEIIGKVNTYMPQDSIFGRLLNHEETYTVVQSVQKGIMQHDLYTWQVQGKDFVSLKEVTNGSKFIDKSIKDWLEKIEVKQREQVIDIIFEMIHTTQVETFAQLRDGWLSNAKTLLQSYRMIEPEDRKMIIETLSALLKIAKDNLMEEYKNGSKSEKVDRIKNS